MACPLHIWVPLMGAAAPPARIARDRFRSSRATQEPLPPKELKRWAPVGAPTSDEPAS